MTNLKTVVSEAGILTCIIANCDEVENYEKQYVTDAVTSYIDNIGSHTRVQSVVTDADTNTDSPINTVTETTRDDPAISVTQHHPSFRW